jgi:hypothetical protein
VLEGVRARWNYLARAGMTLIFYQDFFTAGINAPSFLRRVHHHAGIFL